MRQLWGIGTFVVLIFAIAGMTLAQQSTGGKDKDADQPIRKPADKDPLEDDEEEDDLPDPPPFFGEDGGVGEKMKIMWCLDRSGSMAWAGGTFTGPDGTPTTGSRWDRAVAETTIALSQLTPEWEFSIVTYACSIDSFNEEVVEAKPENIQRGIAYVSGKRPYGGTNTGGGQARSFTIANSGEEGSATCWLLSDGSPNCGAPGTTGHKNLALTANTQGHVLNTVGIADAGIFAAFMRELAEATGGTYVHVQ